MSLEVESVVDSSAVRAVLECGRSRERRLGVGERVIEFPGCIGVGGRVVGSRVCVGRRVRRSCLVRSDANVASNRSVGSHVPGAGSTRGSFMQAPCVGSERTVSVPFSILY